ncbi:MAG: DUF5009 domain-containing protein [Candidatus Spyradosoma sp.]
MTPEPEIRAEAKTPAAPRLASLDALRGADTLCILGLDAFFHALGALFPQSGAARFLVGQFTHKAWEGLALYDLIFPLFVFVAGASMAFSLAKKRERGERATRIVAELFRRAALLALLGFALQGGLSFAFAETRFPSVLALIGISGALGGTLAVLLRTPRRVLAATLALSAALAAAQILGGDFTPENSLNARLDRLLLPGRLYGGVFDPEGILCVAGATVSVLFGFLAGTLLRAENIAPRRKILVLLAAGAALLLAAGIADALGLPVVKKLWTQSFVFAAAGWSATALAAFHLLFDVLPGGRALRAVAYFFRVVGVNALAIYALQWVFDFFGLSRLLFGGVAGFFGEAGTLVLVAGAILLKWLLLRALERRKIFLKIG